MKDWDKSRFKTSDLGFSALFSARSAHVDTRLGASPTLIIGSAVKRVKQQSELYWIVLMCF